MKTITTSVAVLILTLMSMTAVAVPITVIDVGGERSDFLQVDTGESAGVGFTLAGSLLDTLIFPDIFCQVCTGQLLLMQDDVGPTATLTDLVAAVDFANGAAPALVAGDLDAGTYFLILQITSGFAGWIGSNDALVEELLGGVYEISLFANEANTDTTFAGRSNFSALFGFDNYFSVTGESVAVPEPGTALLLLSGLLGVALSRRRKRRA